MTTIKWRNGIWEESVSLEVTHELLTGQGVFETILVKDEVPQFLNLHLARLQKSCEILRITPPDLSYVLAGIEKLLVVHQGSLGRLRITLFGGTPATQLLLSITDTLPWSETASVNISPWTRNENSAIMGAKAASYAENAVALNWAKSAGFSETLMFNTSGMLAEAATSNVVIVIDGQAFTPPSSSGCLPGITRQLILEAGLMKEVDIDVDTLNEASAGALLSSTRGVHPISVLGERVLNAADPTVYQLVQAFATRVAQDKENWAKPR